jgi:outer membrane lipoprotein SlyB
MMNKKFFKAMLSLIIVFSLTSCKELPPGEYDANEIGKIKKVIPGVIISNRKVNLRQQGPDAGVAAKAGQEGLMTGGYNHTHGVEYVIKLNSGGIISVVQSEDLKLKNKQKILVIYGRNTRVVADNGSDVY